MWYGTWDLGIEDWHVKLFIYLVFGLAPTITMLTGLVVGFLHGRMEQGGRWGLGLALLSSPVGLVIIMLAVVLFNDDKSTGRADLDSWVTWLLCAVPHVITGLLFSAVAALKIGAGRRAQVVVTRTGE